MPRSPLTPVQGLAHLLMVPPSESVLRMMYQTGQDDARAWANEQGWQTGVRRRLV